LEPARRGAAGVRALRIFAIAQPLFDLLGRNSTFLVVHGVGGVQLAACGSNQAAAMVNPQYFRPGANAVSSTG
jgi:hypothetical protein